MRVTLRLDFATVIGMQRERETTDSCVQRIGLGLGLNFPFEFYNDTFRREVAITGDAPIAENGYDLPLRASPALGQLPTITVRIAERDLEDKLAVHSPYNWSIDDQYVQGRLKEVVRQVGFIHISSVYHDVDAHEFVLRGVQAVAEISPPTLPEGERADDRPRNLMGRRRRT